MKTTIYNIWTKLVEEFIADICAGTDLHKQIDFWLDEGGNKEFQAAQGKYFVPHTPKFLAAKHSCSEELFDISKEQIVAGFSGWFIELLKQFPSLDNEHVKEKYNLFAQKCVAEKYVPFIASRTAITWQWVQRGNLKDIFFVIDSYKFLEEASKASVTSMDEYVNKHNLVSPVPRSPSSPAFYTQKPGETNTVHSSQLENNIPQNV